LFCGERGRSSAGREGENLGLLELGVEADDGFDELGLLLEDGLGHALVEGVLAAAPSSARRGAGADRNEEARLQPALGAVDFKERVGACSSGNDF
jgi:hypothetical protein